MGTTIPLMYQPQTPIESPQTMAQNAFAVQSAMNQQQLQKQQIQQNALAQQVGQQQLQQQQIETQKAVQQQKDLQIFNDAFKQSNGDYQQALNLATQNGASGAFVTSAQLQHAQAVATMAKSGSDQLDNMQKQLNLIGQTAVKLRSITDPDERATAQKQAYNDLVGIVGPQHLQMLQGGALSDDQLDQITNSNQYALDLTKAAQAAQTQAVQHPAEVASANAKEQQQFAQMLSTAQDDKSWQAALAQMSPAVRANFPDHWSPEAVQQAQQMALTPEQRLGMTQAQADSKYRNILMAQQLGQPVTPGDAAFVKSYEHQKEISAQFRFNQMYGNGAPGSPGSQDMVDLVGNNQIDLATVMSRMPPSQKQAFLAQLSQRYPNYDQAQFGVAKALQQNFTSGTYSQQLNAINTAREHMQTFKQMADALQNGNTQAINKVGNAWQQQFGSAAPTNFQIAKQAFAGEIGKALAGAGVTEGDRQQVDEAINASESPAQLSGAADTADKLLAGKQNALRQTYEQGRKGQPNFGQQNETGSSASTPQKFKVGDSFTQNGHTYKVTSVDANGKVTGAQ